MGKYCRPKLKSSSRVFKISNSDIQGKRGQSGGEPFLSIKQEIRSRPKGFYDADTYVKYIKYLAGEVEWAKIRVRLNTS